MLKLYKKYTLSKMGHTRINKIKIRRTHKCVLIGGSGDDPNLNYMHPLFVHIDSNKQNTKSTTRTFNEILEYENTNNQMQMLYTVINTQLHT